MGDNSSVPMETAAVMQWAESGGFSLSLDLHSGYPGAVYPYGRPAEPGRRGMGDVDVKVTEVHKTPYAP